jgi:hypothetical protein
MGYALRCNSCIRNLIMNDVATARRIVAGRLPGFDEAIEKKMALVLMPGFKEVMLAELRNLFDDELAHAVWKEISMLVQRKIH